jgi:hypothetical protein
MYEFAVRDAGCVLAYDLRVLNLSGREQIIELDAPYPRSAYIRQGAVLMAAKYSVDLLVIWMVTGTLWTPFDYALSLANLHGSKTAAFPSALNFWLLLWTLPFVCVGVILSVRRARDAGLPPWIAVGFFLPIVNYALILLLASWPSKTIWIASEAASAGTVGKGRSVRAIVIGAMAGTAAGVVLVALGVLLIRTYGAAVFIATPFVVGAIAALVADTVEPGDTGQTVTAVLATFGFNAAALLLVGLEGFACVIMAAPLALPIALVGGLVGHSLSGRTRHPGSAAMLMVMVLVPGQTLDKLLEESPIREVHSEIVVDATPDRVWQHVVSFSDIAAPPPWYFHVGLAYPVRARIEGNGVGAVRYCEFSTGAFVEPITAWDAPRRLAFDVVEQPPPLREWSPYRNVYAPHLDGFFRTTKGEFRLTELPGGRTRLEGRTWYSVRMQPQIYWTVISDAIVHRIHDRVLRHIKAETETAPRSIAHSPERSAP